MISFYYIKSKYTVEYKIPTAKFGCLKAILEIFYILYHNLYKWTYYAYFIEQIFFEKKFLHDWLKI